MYKKYHIKNPKIRQMLMSLIKHKNKTEVYDLEYFNKPKFIGMWYCDDVKIRPYMINSIVDTQGIDISLEELIEKILE